MDRVNLRGCDNYLSFLLLINSILHSKENFWIFGKLRRGRGLPDSVALLKTLCILSALLFFFSGCLFLSLCGSFHCVSVFLPVHDLFRNFEIREYEETIFLYYISTNLLFATFFAKIITSSTKIVTLWHPFPRNFYFLTNIFVEFKFVFLSFT